MTNLAQEARELAEGLEEKADEIKKIAQTAKNISTEAVELYKYATIQPDNIR